MSCRGRITLEGFAIPLDQASCWSEWEYRFWLDDLAGRVERPVVHHVEIVAHGGIPRDRFQQGAEVAEGVRGEQVEIARHRHLGFRLGGGLGVDNAILRSDEDLAEREGHPLPELILPHDGVVEELGAEILARGRPVEDVAGRRELLGDGLGDAGVHHVLHAVDGQRAHPVREAGAKGGLLEEADGIGLGRVRERLGGLLHLTELAGGTLGGGLLGCATGGTQGEGEGSATYHPRSSGGDAARRPHNAKSMFN
jgi:hypothetical protein